MKRFSLLLLCGLLCAATGTAFSQGGTLGGNLEWNIDNGVLTISGNGAMPGYAGLGYSPWNGYIADITGVVVGNGVTSIGNYAFPGLTAVTQVTIGTSVTEIGDYAFYGLTALPAVVIPDNVTTLRFHAFSGCTAMTSAHIGAGVTEFFSACFSETGITSINIPEGASIFRGNGHFSYCPNLETVYFDAIRCSDLITGTGMFANCPKFTDVVIGNNVEYIPQGFFSETPSIKNVTIGESVTEIGDNAFIGTGLTAVTIPTRVTTIGNRAFAATALTEVVIPDNVTTMEIGAFRDCVQLTSATIGSGLSVLRSGVFGNTGLTSITIPEGIADLEGNVFTGSNKLETVYFNAVACRGFIITYPDQLPFWECTGLRNIVFGDAVETIPEGIFYSHSTITSVTIGSSVNTIDRYAFAYCSSLTAVDIPNSVVNMGANAFRDCGKLATITLGSGLVDISGSAFSGTAITSITIPENVLIFRAGSAFGNCTQLETVNFNAINCNDLVSIGGLFPGCPRLKNVVIGNTVQRIPNYFFYGVTSIEQLTIGSKCTEIGEGAFWGCSGLIELVIPNTVKTLKYRAFADCTALTSLTIGSGISEISSGAFSNSGLTELTIPSNITSIRSGAFSESASLETVYFNARNCGDMISGDHFRACSFLTTVIVGDNVRRIPNYAFYNVGMESLTIGSDVREIGNWAFYDCAYLETITNKATRPQTINANVFGGVEKEYCTLYVPAASVTDYQAAAVWQDFGSILPINVGIDSNKTFEEPNSWKIENGALKMELSDAAISSPIHIYSLDGRLVLTQTASAPKAEINVSHLPKGIYIVKAGAVSAKIVKQ